MYLIVILILSIYTCDLIIYHLLVTINITDLIY